MIAKEKTATAITVVGKSPSDTEECPGCKPKAACVTLNIFVPAGEGTIGTRVNEAANAVEPMDAKNTPDSPGCSETALEHTTDVAMGASGLLLVSAPTPTELPVDGVACGGTFC